MKSMFYCDETGIDFILFFTLTRTDHRGILLNSRPKLGDGIIFDSRHCMTGWLYSAFLFSVIGGVIMNNNIENILAVLNPNNTMSINRPLAHVIGLNETVVYAALIAKYSYYRSTGRLSEDGWFFSTVTDLQESTTFCRKAQSSAVKNLTLIGLIECEVRGMPAKRYFRICDNTELLMRLISTGLTVSDRLSESCGKRAKKRDSCTEPDEDKVSVENVLKMVETASEKYIVETAQDSSLYPAAQTSSYPAAQTSSSPTVQTSMRPEVQTSSSIPDDKTKENKTKDIKNDISLSTHSLTDARENNFSGVNEVRERDDSASETNAFCEMLAEMGVRSENIFRCGPESEDDLFDFDSGERELKLCRIPYSFHTDRHRMTEALRYMSAYSYFWETAPESSQAKFHSCCVSVLADLVSEDSIQVNGKQVMYYTIIDKINDLTSKDLLTDAFLDFIAEWKAIISVKQISDRKKYFASCLWKWLDEYEFHRTSEVAGKY